MTNEPTVLAVSAHAERKWVGRRSNPRLLVFSQALNRLSYRPAVVLLVVAPLTCGQQKRPDVVVTPGLRLFVAFFAAECHKRSLGEGIFPAE